MRDIVVGVRCVKRGLRLAVQPLSVVPLGGGPCVSDLIIRAAEPGDSEQLAALVNLPGYRHGTLRTPFHSIEWMRKRLETAPSGFTEIVAEQGDIIVGKANLQQFEGRRRHAGTIGIGVHDDFQGKGIGSALLAALIDTADNWLGISRLELMVNSDNPSAIRLYEKAGFEREGLFRAYTFRAGSYIDAIGMARVTIVNEA